jgi:hypothetical protein
MPLWLEWNILNCLHELFDGFDKPLLAPRHTFHFYFIINAAFPERLNLIMKHLYCFLFVLALDECYQLRPAQIFTLFKFTDTLLDVGF